MSLHFDNLDDALNEYGLNPDLLPKPDEEDTQPAEQVQAQPAIRPLTLMPSYTPPSQAYSIIDAVLRLSGATNGAPILEHCRVGYEIVITPALRYQVSIAERLATVVTVIAGGQVQVTRYPKLSPSEFCKLFLVWKQ